MEYYLAIRKNKIVSFAGKMDGIGDHHVKQNKLDSEIQILHVFSQKHAEAVPKEQINMNINGKLFGGGSER
jgi:hypothetical protein